MSRNHIKLFIKMADVALMITRAGKRLALSGVHLARKLRQARARMRRITSPAGAIAASYGSLSFELTGLDAWLSIDRSGDLVAKNAVSDFAADGVWAHGALNVARARDVDGLARLAGGTRGLSAAALGHGAGLDLEREIGIRVFQHHGFLGAQGEASGEEEAGAEGGSNERLAHARHLSDTQPLHQGCLSGRGARSVRSLGSGKDWAITMSRIIKFEIVCRGDAVQSRALVTEGGAQNLISSQSADGKKF